MGHTSKRVTALMLALTMISTFPATTALALEAEPVIAAATSEQPDISTPETANLVTETEDYASAADSLDET